MAMNRIDTAKFVISLTERIINENPGAAAKDVYTKVFNACSPLIVNGDLDSQLWVDLAEYLFPTIAGKTKTSEQAQRIERLEKELEQSAKKNRELASENRRLENELDAEKKKTKRATPAPTPRPAPSSYSYTSDPCGRSSVRSGGC